MILSFHNNLVLLHSEIIMLVGQLQKLKGSGSDLNRFFYANTDQAVDWIFTV